MIPRHGGDGASHFAFQIDSAEDLDAIRDNLRGRGVAIESEICWPGTADARSIYCRDPAGNSVEFATRSLWFREA